MRRVLSFAIGLSLSLSFGLASAQNWNVQERNLPEMGSSAGELLTPAKRAEYGSMMLAQLRHYNLILEDPLLNRWLNQVGQQLGKNSAKPNQDFTFFLVKDRQINAFATLGGYIGMNAGLILAADKEDEVAGVLSHEIAHVTQDHVLRSVERAKRDQLPMMLAILGAIAAAQSGSSSSGNAAMAIMTGAMGIAQQRQINYTRSGEQEADRIGIQTMIRTGYDPNAMADFFQVLQTRLRANGANYSGEDPPEYLMTHPVTLTRISEARALAEQYSKPGGMVPKNVAVPTIENRNSLLPKSLQVPVGAVEPKSNNSATQTGPKSFKVVVRESAGFAFARERLRVLSEELPKQTLKEYQTIQRNGTLSEAQKYGLAVALAQSQEYKEALSLLTPLKASSPDNIWVSLSYADVLNRSGDVPKADAEFEQLVKRFPNDRAVALTYAESLTNRNNAASAKRALDVLRPLEGKVNDDPLYWLSVARAAQVSGDPVRAGEAFAENAYTRGFAEQALVQYETLKRRNDLDYYSRSRIDARIAKIKPLVLELRRQGQEDPDLHGRRVNPSS